MSADANRYVEHIARAAIDLDPDRAGQVAAWASELSRLLDEVRHARPHDGTDEERAFLERVGETMQRLVAILGDDYHRVFEAASLAPTSALIAREIEETDASRKLALRFLESAFEAFAELTSHYARLFAHVSVEERAALIRWGARGVPVAIAAGPDARELLRWQIDLLIGLGCLSAENDELAYWSQRALTGSRRMKAWLATSAPASLAGVLARVRAQAAWVDWDSEEIQSEIAPWPSA